MTATIPTMTKFMTSCVHNLPPASAAPPIIGKKLRWQLGPLSDRRLTRSSIAMKASWTSALFFGIALLCTGARIAHADDLYASAAAFLHARYDGLHYQLDHNQFQKPLYLDSSEISDSVTGDIHARINYPFATVRAALNNPGDWCDILILHCSMRASDDPRCASIGNQSGLSQKAAESDSCGRPR